MNKIIKILLSISIVLLSYLCIVSVLTPIRFEKVKANREAKIIQYLIDIRTVELEYKDQKGRYTASFDSLIEFVKVAKKKMVMKEGSLTDEQLEAGLTEAMAVKIVRSANRAKIAAIGLQGFVRDTAYMPMMKALFSDRYTAETIEQMAIIPFSKKKRFDLVVKNDYLNSTGEKISLFEASATFQCYLYDLDRQEVQNAIDLEEKLFRFPGLKIGSVDEPTNNAGNWE